MFFKDTEPGKNAGDRLMVVDGSEYTITQGEQQHACMHGGSLYVWCNIVRQTQ